jgi:hypothetical protein
MSDYDGGDYGHDSLVHGEQEQDLNQLHNEYGDQHDSLNASQQYAHEAGYENDQDFSNGHHVEYDNPNGSHFEQTDYTNASSHEAAYESDFGQSSVNASSDASFGELDALQERFAAEFTGAEHDSSIVGK